MKSPVDNDRQFELDALWSSEPVKTGEGICNVLRATKTGDRPSSTEIVICDSGLLELNDLIQDVRVSAAACRHYSSSAKVGFK